MRGDRLGRVISNTPISMTTKSAPGNAVPEPKRSARDRLLKAAGALFYAEGIQSVGIDRVIERAGVAKASLYSTFGSKEELVRAYLEERHAKLMAWRRAAVAAVDDPVEKILAVFESQARDFSRADFNGCAFAGAMAESPPSGSVAEASQSFREDIRGLFEELAADAGPAPGASRDPPTARCCTTEPARPRSWTATGRPWRRRRALGRRR